MSGQVAINELTSHAGVFRGAQGRNTSSPKNVAACVAGGERVSLWCPCVP